LEIVEVIVIDDWLEAEMAFSLVSHAFLKAKPCTGNI